MKELIEEIKELLRRSKNFSSPTNEYNAGCSYGIERCLEEIQKQESKPFDPLELGFELDENKHFYKNVSNIHYLIEPLKTSNVFILKQYIKPNYELDYPSSYNDIPFKAPNHRQGVELLQNLGVIE